MSSKRLEREAFWYRELCTIYPYGLNDNVKKFGNVSKIRLNRIVYSLFNKQPRKFRKRQQIRHRKRIEKAAIDKMVGTWLTTYKNLDFTFKLRTYIFSLPKNKLLQLLNLVEERLVNMPARFIMLIKDLIAFRKITNNENTEVNVEKENKQDSGFMTTHFHNKGIEMIDLPRILNGRDVRSAVPNVLNNVNPPIVGYTYSKSIASQIFNHNKVVEELDFDVGMKDMKCECSSSSFCYSPARHIVTGDLKLIKDIKLRNMIAKGPNCKEQNNINWNVNSKICKELCLNTK